MRDKDSLKRLLKESVIQLCKVGIEDGESFEIDGLICITRKSNQEDIVIKLHECLETDKKEELKRERQNNPEASRRESPLSEGSITSPDPSPLRLYGNYFKGTSTATEPPTSQHGQSTYREPQTCVYTCSLCNKGFPSHSALYHHFSRKYGITGAYVCPDCGSGFASKSEFANHKLMCHRANRAARIHSRMNTGGRSLFRHQDKKLANPLMSSTTDGIRLHTPRKLPIRPQKLSQLHSPSLPLYAVDLSAVKDEPVEEHTADDIADNGVGLETQALEEESNRNDDAQAKGNTDEFRSRESLESGEESTAKYSDKDENAAESFAQPQLEPLNIDHQGHVQTSDQLVDSQSVSSVRDFTASETQASRGVPHDNDVTTLNTSGNMEVDESTGDVEIVMQSQTADCVVCSVTLNNMSELEGHVLDVHARYICLYCRKLFTQKGNRDRHARVHTGEKPYKCMVCSSSFSRKEQLVQHEKIRHNMDPLHYVTRCLTNMNTTPDFQSN